MDYRNSCRVYVILGVKDTYIIIVDKSRGCDQVGVTKSGGGLNPSTKQGLDVYGRPVTVIWFVLTSYYDTSRGMCKDMIFMDRGGGLSGKKFFYRGSAQKNSVF